ncbi:hypothetical protein BJ741DRAFT_707364 [Chytriomyces cf. hyalinus JEL632]|nr:hypothetical protein BJ741DRAFT_707364 [Chytriomyces cf. hyalinus JEL632]
MVSGDDVASEDVAECACFGTWGSVHVVCVLRVNGCGSDPDYGAFGKVVGATVVGSKAFDSWKPQSLQEHLVTKKTVPHCVTPPYLTATPFTTHRRITASKDLFMILATGGLTDELSSKEAVSIVHGFMRVVQAVEKGTKRVWGKDPLTHQKGWVLDRDDNAAACLVRNAFGGKDDAVSRILSVEYPDSRDVRDDVSVQVVFFRGDSSSDGVHVDTLVEDARLGVSCQAWVGFGQFVSSSGESGQLPKWIQWLKASKSAN